MDCRPACARNTMATATARIPSSDAICRPCRAAAPLSLCSSPARDPVADSVDVVNPGADAVAEHRGLGLGGGAIVRRAQELDAPGVAVEQRALGELGLALARGIDRAGVDEMDPVAGKLQPAVALQLGHFVAVDLVHALRVAVAEKA